MEHIDFNQLLQTQVPQITIDLPVIVITPTGEGQLLGTARRASIRQRDRPTLIGKAVLEQLKSWNCDDKVSSVCFDTTTSNTEIKNGDCLHLQDKLGTTYFS